MTSDHLPGKPLNGGGPGQLELEPTFEGVWLWVLECQVQLRPGDGVLEHRLRLQRETQVSSGNAGSGKATYCRPGAVARSKLVHSRFPQGR